MSGPHEMRNDPRGTYGTHRFEGLCTPAWVTPHPLYRTEDMRTRKVHVKSTIFRYIEVKSFSERAKSLNISSQLSVNVLSGAIGVSGGAAYIKSQRDTNESTTVAFISQCRTMNQSLDLAELEGRAFMTPDSLAKTRATHVVTSITYGGDVIGTLSRKSTSKETSTSGKIKYALETFKGLGAALNAEGDVMLGGEVRTKLNDHDFDVELTADVRLSGQGVPTNAASMFDLVKKSSSLIGDGVPCEIRLTPLDMLFSNIPTVRELAEADLVDFHDTYDDILRLENSRVWLRDEVNARSMLFPTFADEIRARTVAVTRLVQRARDKLRTYLWKYRNASTNAPGEVTDGDGSKTPGRFIVGIKKKKKFDAEIRTYEEDRDQWRELEHKLAAAEEHGFPFLSVNAVRAAMTCAGKAMLAMVLIPEGANWDALMNLYGDFAVDIRHWRRSVDKEPDEGDPSGLATQYASIYADPLRDAALYSLDDQTRTLHNALQTARATRRAIFLTYGPARSHLRGFRWHVLNQEGWGIIVNEPANWRYVSDVHLSQPHGSGVMTYVNKTKYVGSFVHGQRDGEGRIIDERGTDVPNMSGVFINNVLESQGVMVDVTVMDESRSPVQYGRVALNMFDAVRAHVDRIGMVMNWGETERHRLVLGGGAAQVDVLGSMVDPCENPAIQSSYWPLAGAPRIMAYRHDHY